MESDSSNYPSPAFCLLEESTAGTQSLLPNDGTVHIIFGNHNTLYGIGEILYSLYTCLSSRYRIRISPTVQPNQVNIIIDEFFNPHFVEQLKRVRKNSSGTRYVIVATEFVTAISLLGLRIGETFNFFGRANDW